MHPMFLHLEDIKNNVQMKELWDGQKVVDTSDDILPLLHDFYQHLYEKSSFHSEKEIKQFLRKLQDLPQINNSKKLLGDISYREIESAIAKLSSGKSSGFDGITAEFYKHFSEFVSPVLEVVYKAVFAQKGLSFSQCLAIIILLFKKGDLLQIPNYRPISLMNNDYNILAYILADRLMECLPNIIHPNQTAYIPK